MHELVQIRIHILIAFVTASKTGLSVSKGTALSKNPPTPNRAARPWQQRRCRAAPPLVPDARQPAAQERAGGHGCARAPALPAGRQLRDACAEPGPGLCRAANGQRHHRYKLVSPHGYPRCGTSARSNTRGLHTCLLLGRKAVR